MEEIKDKVMDETAEMQPPTQDEAAEMQPPTQDEAAEMQPPTQDATADPGVNEEKPQEKTENPQEKTENPQEKTENPQEKTEKPVEKTEKPPALRLSKTYKSGTVVSFNVRKKGARRVTHVVFDLLTLGGSTFVTDDPRLQEAIESHRLFKEGAIRIDSQEGECMITPPSSQADAMITPPSSQADTGIGPLPTENTPSVPYTAAMQQSPPSHPSVPYTAASQQSHPSPPTVPYAAMPSQQSPSPAATPQMPATPCEVVEFASVVEGKDYLADRYGVSRTQLRTRAAIEALAAEKGLKVAWK